MVVKVFVLGLPGCGKSTLARLLEMSAKDRGWSVLRLGDYEILHEMFKADAKGNFRSTEHNGFDVLNMDMFDVALGRLEQGVRDSLPSSEQDVLVIIEFARNDYPRALARFSSEFRRDAYFLFVEADIPTCISRIRERVLHPTTPDDHFVSEYIFEKYYQKDTGKYTTSILDGVQDIDVQRIVVVDNTCSQKALFEKAQQVIDAFCRKQDHELVEVHSSLSQKARQTEPLKSTVSLNEHDQESTCELLNEETKKELVVF